jgi:hypothetical protein
MFNVASRGEEILALVRASSHRMQPPLSASLKPQSTIPCLNPRVMTFPHLLSSYHKSTQTCLLLP